MIRLAVHPLTLREARAFVDLHHRHSRAPQGGLFAIGASGGGEMAGVVIVGRPVARHMADGWTAEVTRLCTDGTPNACSLLYGAAWRAARAMGYRRLVTYTLAVEPGTSLRAAGWRVVAKVPRRSWDRPERPRVDLHPLQERLRWEVSEGGFDRRRYDVGPLPEAEARPFVEANHYSAVSVRAVQGAGRVSQRFIRSMQRGRERGR